MVFFSQDMENGVAWRPRTSSSTERIYSEVEYISSNERSYLDFDLSVRYEPERSPLGPSARSLTADGAAEVSNCGSSVRACEVGNGILSC